MVQHDGREALRKLVVSGIERKVVVNLFIVSFWKIKTGRVPACSEPRIGLRFASQISPRLTVIEHPRWPDLCCNPLYLPLPAHDLLRQSQRKEFSFDLRRVLVRAQAKTCDE